MPVVKMDGSVVVDSTAIMSRLAAEYEAAQAGGSRCAEGILLRLVCLLGSTAAAAVSVGDDWIQKEHNQNWEQKGCAHFQVCWMCALRFSI